MSSCKRTFLVPFAMVTLLAGCAAVQDETPPRYGLGLLLTESELAGWNIDIDARGRGLPSGRGSVAEGKVVYDTKCFFCHGKKGEGQPANQLVGGNVKGPRPIKTVGSYWPYATTLYDYINRAMPWNKPQSLTPNEIYAVSAYILHLNGI